MNQWLFSLFCEFTTPAVLQFMAHLFVFVSSWLTNLLLSLRCSLICLHQFMAHQFVLRSSFLTSFCQFMAHLFVFVSSVLTCLLLSVHGSSVCFCQFSPHLFVLISLWLTSCCYIKVLLTNIGFDHFVIIVHDSPTLVSFMYMRFSNFSFNPIAEQLLLS